MPSSGQALSTKLPGSLGVVQPQTVFISLGTVINRFLVKLGLIDGCVKAHASRVHPCAMEREGKRAMGLPNVWETMHRSFQST